MLLTCSVVRTPSESQIKSDGPPRYNWNIVASARGAKHHRQTDQNKYMFGQKNYIWAKINQYTITKIIFEKTVL
jgi:hypothetical protein